MYRKTVSKYAVLVLLVLSVTVFAMWLGIFVAENDVAQKLISDYGYLGAFLLGVVSGFNFIAPIPAAALIPSFAAANANLPLTVAVIVLGMTIGDLAGYIIGKTGRAVFSESYKQKIAYIEKVRERYHTAPLFLLFLYAAFVPMPNEILVVPMGFLGYHLKHIFPVVLAGNIIFNTITSLAFLGIFQQIM